MSVRTASGIIGVVAMFGLMLGMGAGVWAQDIVLPGRATSMAAEQAALRDARRQSAQAAARSEQLEAQAQNAREEAQRARARMAALAARVQQTQADIRAGQARIAILARLERAQAARLAQKRAPAVRLLAALQNVSRRPPELAMVRAASLRDAVHTRAVFATALPIIAARTAGLRADLDRSRRLRALTQQAGRALTASRDTLSAQQVQLQQLEARQRIAAKTLGANASMEQDRAMAMGERARDIADLLDQLEQAGDVRDRLVTLPGPEPRPAHIAGTNATTPPARERTPDAPSQPAYRLPVVGTLVTGMGEMGGSGVRARGLTLAVEPGAQIVAPARGHVAFAGPYRGYGRILIIDHGGGWTSLIVNMGRVTAQVGRRVDMGDPVGVAGPARADITVELRRHGRPMDITALMNAG